VEWYDEQTSNFQHACDLLKKLDKPAGILVLDRHADEILLACEHAHLSVPEDVKIITYQSSVARYGGGQRFTTFIPNIEAELPVAVYYTLKQIMDKTTNYTVKCCISVNFVPGDSFVLSSGGGEGGL
jgi:DNA-binding LacI/PurR family transcriptional regulator